MKSQFGNRNKYTYYTLLLFICSCSVFNKQTHHTSMDCSIFKRIYFLEHFDSDTVSILVDRKKIVDSIVSSHPSTGLALFKMVKGSSIEIRINKDTVFKYNGCDEKFNGIVLTKEDAIYFSAQAKDTVIVVM